MPASLQRNAAGKNLQVGFRSGRVEGDRAAVLDRAAEWEDRAMADDHAAGVRRYWLVVEQEVIGRQRSCIHAEECDRFTGACRNDRIAGGVIRDDQITESGHTREG